jgi:RNA polymerase sigma-70 factor, ECF subfamily
MSEKNDDDGEFVRLLTAHEPQIRGSIMILVPDWHDAQDIMQKVSVVLWSKFSTFQKGTSFLGWAMVIAKLEVKDHWKRKKRERMRFSNEFVDLVMHETESMAIELDDRRRVLQLCVSRLKPKDRELLKLRYYDGASIDDISSAVGRSCDAVYKALGRLRMALVECVRRRTVAGEA